MADLQIDRENNVAYLTLGESDRNSTRYVPALEFGDIDLDLVIDYAADGSIIGFEFLNARVQLGPVWDIWIEAGK